MPYLLTAQRFIIIFLMSGFLDGGSSWHVFVVFMPPYCARRFSSCSSLTLTFSHLLPPLVCVIVTRERGELVFAAVGTAVCNGFCTLQEPNGSARLATQDLAQPPPRPPLTAPLMNRGHPPWPRRQQRPRYPQMDSRYLMSNYGLKWPPADLPHSSANG